jgi:hypothetical protein
MGGWDGPCSEANQDQTGDSSEITDRAHLNSPFHPAHRPNFLDCGIEWSMDLKAVLVCDSRHGLTLLPELIDQASFYKPAVVIGRINAATRPILRLR